MARVAALAVVVSLAAIGLAWWGLARWAVMPVTPPVPVVVDVRQGEGFAGVGRRLAEAGVVNSAWLLRLRARQRGVTTRIKPGEFLFDVQASPDVVLDRLVVQDVIVYRVTLLEGQTFTDMVATLEDTEELLFDLEGIDVETALSRLQLGEGHAEGWFFPDTYQFERGHTASDILRRANGAMREALEAAWADRDSTLPLHSPYDVLIMASIVEKESGVPSDRRKISGVFARRLDLGMRLQTDPTVIYGLGSSFDGNLKRIHLETDGPYNTYRRHGLPPTPIAAPSGDALLAAVNPQEGRARCISSPAATAPAISPSRSTITTRRYVDTRSNADDARPVCHDGRC